MRAEFEAWASDNGALPKAVERANDGHYFHLGTQAGWMVWQAAWQAAYRATSGESNSVKSHQVKASEPVELPEPDLWRDERGIRGYVKDPGPGPWYTADTVRTLLTRIKETSCL